MEADKKEQQMLEKLYSGEIEYVTVIVPVTGQLFCKRFEASFFKKNILTEGFKFPEFCLCFNIENDPIPNGDYILGQKGDLVILPDKSTLRNMSWLGKEHLICIGDINTNEDYYPRSILKNTLKRVAEKHNVKFLCASELEFYVLKDKNPNIIKDYPEINLEKFKQTTRNSDYCLPTLMDRNETYAKKMKDNIISCGIELEGLMTEHGPGQHEINIKYSEPLRNCDNHIILKQCIKHTAYEEGLGVSFMAKTFIDKDGNSSHVHLSVYDCTTNENYFSPSQNPEENFVIELKDRKTVPIHKNMYYFIGGLTKYVEDLFLVYAPFVNSYKRFKKHSYAPVAINTWCYDTRFASFRVIGSGDKLRVEIRIAGSDVNPYLLLTAIISSGMKGIEDKVIPPEMERGNTYEEKKSHHINAPINIFESIKIFEKSEYPKEIFGENYKNFLIKLATKEWDDFNNHISTYEIHRYLDLV